MTTPSGPAAWPTPGQSWRRGEGEASAVDASGGSPSPCPDMRRRPSWGMTVSWPRRHCVSSWRRGALLRMATAISLAVSCSRSTKSTGQGTVSVISAWMCRRSAVSVLACQCQCCVNAGVSIRSCANGAYPIGTAKKYPIGVGFSLLACAI